MISPSDFTGAFGCLARYAAKSNFELVTDHAAVAQEVLDARHDDVDDFGAQRFEAVERLPNDAGDLTILRCVAPQRAQHPDARALESVRIERIAVRLRNLRGALGRDRIVRVGPTVASSMIARSVTLRASGPAISRVDDSGITPRVTRKAVRATQADKVLVPCRDANRSAGVAAHACGGEARANRRAGAATGTGRTSSVVSRGSQT